MSFRGVWQKISRKKTWLIVFCMLISTLLWVLIKFSKVYQEDMYVLLGYKDIPEGMFLEQSYRSRVKVKASGSGFALVKFNLEEKEAIISMNRLLPIKQNVYSLPQTMVQFLNAKGFSNITIRNVMTDTVHIPLQKKTLKKIPVIFQPNASYRLEYQLTDLIIEPDSVTVTGYKNTLDTLTGVYLQGSQKANIYSSFEEKFPLENTNRIHYSDTMISVKAIVSKMSERVIKVPIMLRHTPKDANLKLFPTEIELVCSGAIEYLKTVKPSDFQVEADYNNREESTNSIPLKVVRSPKKLNTKFLSEKKVEFLIRKK